MIDLQLSCGLPIKFDEIGESFNFGEGVIFDSINKVPLSSLLPGLLNKSLRYPEFVYTEHHNVRNQSDNDKFHSNPYNYDLVMLPAGLMGVEFIRSHIFRANSTQVSVSEIVEVLFGSLTILLQKNFPKENSLDFYTRVSEGLVIRLEAGEKFAVPTNYYYTYINTEMTPVVFTRFFSNTCVCDYTDLKNEKGLAYYAIKKNAKQEIVLNPRYREIPTLNVRSAKEFDDCTRLGIDMSKPLYEQLIINANTQDLF